LEATIAKEQGNQVERTVGYNNDNEALGQEFASDTEVDELQTVGIRAD